MPVSCMDNWPFHNLLITFQSAQGEKGIGSQKGETITRQQVRMKPRQLWEHKGERTVLPIRLYSPELLHFSCNWQR